MDYQLNYQLDQLRIGFYTKKEKTHGDVRFDNYAYSRKRSIFLIWELEIENAEEMCINNVEKVQKILSHKWYPYVHMFHVFSPSCEGYKESCEKMANRLKKKNEIRFTYKQFDIDIPYDEFLKMENLFQKNPKLGERKFGRRLRVHLGKIVRQSIAMFTG